MSKGAGLGIALGLAAVVGLVMVSRSSKAAATPLPVPPDGGGGVTPTPPDGGGGGASLLAQIPDYPVKDINLAVAYVINKGQQAWGVVNGTGVSTVDGALTTLGLYLQSAAAFRELNYPGLSAGCQPKARAAIESAGALYKYGDLMHRADQSNFPAVVAGLNHDLTASLTLWAELQTGMGSQCAGGPSVNSNCSTVQAWAAQLESYVAALDQDCRTNPAACETVKDYRAQLDKVKAALAACKGAA